MGSECCLPSDRKENLLEKPTKENKQQDLTAIKSR